MSIFGEIKQNFRMLIESGSITGSLTNTMHESKTLLKPDHLAGSNWNGAYLLKIKGIPEADQTVNRRTEYKYQVTLSNMFLISAGDSVTSYDNAVEDVETIMNARLDVTTFGTGSIGNITLNAINEPVFQSTTDSTFLIINSDWDVTGIYQY